MLLPARWVDAVLVLGFFSFSSLPGGTLLEEKGFPQTPSEDLWVGGTERAYAGCLVAAERFWSPIGNPNRRPAFATACGGQDPRSILREGFFTRDP